MPKRNIELAPELIICYFNSSFCRLDKRKYRFASTERYLIRERLLRFFNSRQISEHHGRLWHGVSEEDYKSLNPLWLELYIKHYDSGDFGGMKTLKELSDYLLEGNELVVTDGSSSCNIWLSTTEQEDRAEEKATLLYYKLLKQFTEYEIENAIRMNMSSTNILEDPDFIEYANLGTPPKTYCFRM